MTPTWGASWRWRRDVVVALLEEFADEFFAVTVRQAVEEMGEWATEGCTDMILYFYDMGEGDSLDLFASEVIPQLR